MPNAGWTRITRSFLVVACVASSGSAFASTGYLPREEVRSFIAALHEEHGIEVSELERVLGAARHQPAVVRLIGPEPRTTGKVVRSYPAYRARFLTPARIAAGVHYWSEYEGYLQRAEQTYGVPAEVILGILGVETAFGRNTGSFRIIDALATIAFDGPRRQDYFRDELKELLLLAQDRQLDPLSFKGSYAGAMGLPQFMPSSYRRYAVDFDEDGAVDLIGSPADAIGSIARYLSAFGWKSGEPAMAPVRLPTGKEADLVTGLKRTQDVAALKAEGVKFSTAKTPAGECSIVELPTPGKASRYVAGFANFEAVTHYNRSTFYATAVLELADAIHAARMQQLTANAER